jgi:hypothetical protein
VNLERFADGHLTQVTADGSRVSLRLEAYADCRRVPGEVSVVEVFELSADPGEVAMAEPPDAGHCLEEPSSWEADGVWTAEFFAPLRIRVTAAAFRLTLVRTERRPVLPEPSANVCTFELAELPALGPDVVWRALGGEAGTPADPDGWFLQRRDRLTSSPTGISARPPRTASLSSARTPTTTCGARSGCSAGTRAACGPGTASSGPPTGSPG